MLRFIHIVVCNIASFLLKYFIYLFWERGKGKEKERERNISVWLLLVCSLLGTQPATQVCALTGTWTRDPLVHRLALNPLSHTSQGLLSKFHRCENRGSGHFWTWPRRVTALAPRRARTQRSDLQVPDAWQHHVTFYLCLLYRTLLVSPKTWVFSGVEDRSELKDRYNYSFYTNLMRCFPPFIMKYGKAYGKRDSQK